MQQDPCWTAPAFPADNHPASVTCRRAANAFNSRDEEDRSLCPYTVGPKCRFFAGTYAQQCSVKKLRARSQTWCTFFGSRHVPVALSHCAQPLFPGVPAAVPPAELAMYRRM
ncbi:unnamed protein product [Bemisia tabaci]|uniref:Uncharacterized protein n=1 Tax=Bemisia tabaci TaxID=7038 RepID=A0A9P0F731_BEMTA|nr:unnamed protein product [Bemisia tabaci]